VKLSRRSENFLVGFGHKLENPVHKLKATIGIFLSRESACQGGVEVSTNHVRLICRINAGDLTLKIGECEFSLHPMGYNGFKQTFAH